MASIVNSAKTFELKKAFPAVFYTLMVAVFIGGIFKRPFDPTFVVMPVLAAFGLTALMWLLVWDLADEVVDEGDCLRVRKGRIEERVMLRDVVKVSYSGNTNPVRLSLWLHRPNRLGDRIVFIPKGFYWRLIGEHPMAEELRARAERLRKHT
ncbi:hypothetical protein [Lysobacter capsici]|uniref:hypothetical protein n=1 Tax=Lysobacter capsici TaxID=435897 RepID=UPI000BBAB32D|nr:hypothetical protein [Lysobacter capsici]ATE71363.1 hypothetical protein CNO08_08360 [Lysobacter capsici]